MATVEVTVRISKRPEDMGLTRPKTMRAGCEPCFLIAWLAATTG